MHNSKYLYTFKYDTHNAELCKLESRQLFGEEEQHKQLCTNIKIDPSLSPFIKNRFEFYVQSEDYEDLLKKIKQLQITTDGFKVVYLVLEGDNTNYKERLSKQRDVGYSIDGTPDYDAPSLLYAICYHNNAWQFGYLVQHNKAWFSHKKKPHSFSSAINMDIAKALVSICSKGDNSKTLLDACCGVGTVMLEACISKINIEGCDIHWRACVDTRANLAHFKYEAKVYRTDIKDHTKLYDAAIIDLPYNLYTSSDDSVILNIIQSTAKLCSRMVIASTANIEQFVTQSGMRVTDHCYVGKKGKNFQRIIWVCEPE